MSGIGFPEPPPAGSTWYSPPSLLESYGRAPEQIVLDLDATDDPLHGTQEGRFFHGYYDSYCYLPLYIFCGRQLLVAQIRARWPKVRIIVSVRRVKLAMSSAHPYQAEFITAFQGHWLIAIAQNTRHRDTPRHSGLKSHLWRDMRAKR